MKRLILLPLLLLAGCASPEQIESAKVQQCTNMGASPGSKKYYDCRQKLEEIAGLEQARRDAESRRQTADFQNLQRQNQLIDAMMYQKRASDIHNSQPVTRQPFNCTTRQVGEQAETYCY